ncbi:MAG: antibiotic biosynthesis monooxygenase family protein [Cyanobacteria bacterium P01_D01_bin.6]
MTQLDLENQLITVIVLFKVKLRQQMALIDQVKQLFDIAKQQPGFVSANLHRSLDEVKVANYAQWENEAALEQFRQRPETQALWQQLQNLVDEATHTSMRLWPQNPRWVIHRLLRASTTFILPSFGCRQKINRAWLHLPRSMLVQRCPYWAWYLRTSTVPSMASG